MPRLLCSKWQDQSTSWKLQAGLLYLPLYVCPWTLAPNAGLCVIWLIVRQLCASFSWTFIGFLYLLSRTLIPCRTKVFVAASLYNIPVSLTLIKNLAFVPVYCFFCCLCRWPLFSHISSTSGPGDDIFLLAFIAACKPLLLDSYVNINIILEALINWLIYLQLFLWLPTLSRVSVHGWPIQHLSLTVLDLFNICTHFPPSLKLQNNYIEGTL